MQMKGCLLEIVAKLPFLVTRHLQPVERTVADYICPLIVGLSKAQGGFQGSKVPGSKELSTKAYISTELTRH